jgi:tetratricopeptide (TPR) repeat protein
MNTKRDLFFKEGIDDYTSENFDSAIDHFQKLIIDNPNDAEACKNLGRCYQERANKLRPSCEQASRDYEKAIMYYHQAKDLNSDLSEICDADLSSCLGDMGDLKSAMEYALRGTEKEKKNK